VGQPVYDNRDRGCGCLPAIGLLVFIVLAIRALYYLAVVVF